jgi:hypothetical protein
MVIGYNLSSAAHRETGQGGEVVKKVLMYCQTCQKLQLVTKVYKGMKLTVTCDTCGNKN